MGHAESSVTHSQSTSRFGKKRGGGFLTLILKFGKRPHRQYEIDCSGSPSCNMRVRDAKRVMSEAPVPYLDRPPPQFGLCGLIHGKIVRLGVTVIPSAQIICAKADLALSLSVAGITHPSTGHVFDLALRT
jgi:hypothetical protein